MFFVAGRHYNNTVLTSTCKYLSHFEFSITIELNCSSCVTRYTIALTVSCHSLLYSRRGSPSSGRLFENRGTKFWRAYAQWSHFHAILYTTGVSNMYAIGSFHNVIVTRERVYSGCIIGQCFIISSSTQK